MSKIKKTAEKVVNKVRDGVKVTTDGNATGKTIFGKRQRRSPARVAVSFDIDRPQDRVLKCCIYLNENRSRSLPEASIFRLFSWCR
jgi:hypothetical protein